MKNFRVTDSNEVMAVRLFPQPEPKNALFLLSRNGVGRVHEKFSPCRFERGKGC